MPRLEGPLVFLVHYSSTQHVVAVVDQLDLDLVDYDVAANAHLRAVIIRGHTDYVSRIDLDCDHAATVRLTEVAKRTCVVAVRAAYTAVVIDLPARHADLCTDGVGYLTGVLVGPVVVDVLVRDEATVASDR